ncbi:MAG: hypothetical protein A3G87_06580 [Omnitrophica bacterium RIFCSPLOWO2_12_FULL_50_11]|nr:MAG: hypothetical protein A3G87_06580 [Omnitrophica bacterium RIFCSPLOWO2_12_FULL_50_11]
MQPIAIIPARLQSTRLPRKLLRTIDGKSLLEYVWRRVKQAKSIGRVIVACDHEELKRCVEFFGGEAILTSVHHESGTERIAEVAEQLACDIVVNVQGDEPLIHPETVDQVVRGLELDESCAMATACVVKSDPEGYRNPNVVKVTKDKRGRALYFSRSPIPCDRNGTAQNYLKHLGIYAYRRGFLLQFPALAPSALERREKLEQLRALENGYQIKVIETIHDSIGVDTEEDFELVNSVILRS